MSRFKIAPGSCARRYRQPVTDIAEFLVGKEIHSISDGRFMTAIDKRPIPARTHQRPPHRAIGREIRRQRGLYVSFEVSRTATANRIAF